MNLWNNILWLDEVGRWPLAGPVSVGGVFCLPEFRDKLPERYNQVTDSKKLTAWHREHLALLISSDPRIIVAVASSSAKIIDRYGIVAAIREASVNVIDEITNRLWVYDDVKIMLDWKTDYGIRQKISLPLEILVKGDSLIWQIAAASIVAKVQRDAYMVRLSQKKKYQPYRFDRHKGYGTLLHRTAIAEYGLSDMHRKSFCKNYSNLLPDTTITW